MAVGIPRNKLASQTTPTTGGPVFSRPQTGGPLTSPTPNVKPQMDQLNASRQQILNEIHRRGGLTKAGGFATKLNDINTQIRGLRKPGQVTPTPEATTPTPAAPTTDVAAPATPEAPSNVNSALYPSMNYQLPENYQGSPLYKWQMQEGTTALNRKLAQRGLLDSGAELEATNRLSQSVGAQESDRLRSDYQTEADRYERVSANEANRLQNQEQNAWSRRMDLFNALNKQSPMQYAYQGLGSYSGLDMNQGKANSANTANNYKRVSAGGGRSVAPFTPPAASGPDYSNVALLDMLFNNSSTRNNSGIVDNLIGGFGSFLK